MTDRLRVGAVAYLNARPLTYGLELLGDDPRFELSLDVPSALARQMRSGELDVALLPVIELARNADLEIVPGLGIGTDGPARSVLLVSRSPLEQIESVALDAESRTSNVLVQLLLWRALGRRLQFETGPPHLDTALDRFDAALRIGDKALFDTQAEDATVIDLGEAWRLETGLPFIYAAWVARRGVVDRSVYRLLHDSRRIGCAALEAIADQFRWDGDCHASLARDYLAQNIRYRLGAAELDGMRRFFAGAAELQLIDAAPELRLALERRTSCHDAADRATAGRLSQTKGAPCP